MKNLTTLVLIILPLLVTAGDAQNTVNRLIQFGDGYRFGVTEPDTWVGDTRDAGKYSADIIFYRKGQDTRSPYGLIRVRVGKKVDKNTAEDLAYDMKGYKEQFPDVQFAELPVTHRQYRCFSKLFFVPNQFHEYVTYVNPGPSAHYLLSISLSTQSEAASEEELAAYETVVSSLEALPPIAIADTVGDHTKAGPNNTEEFNAALGIADRNLLTKEGEQYDKDFAQSCGPWLANELSACTSRFGSPSLEPLTFLFRVSSSGTIEQMRAMPETKVAQYLLPIFKNKSYPKPPESSWWVKMHVSFE
jgi:hypothetical protein